MEVTDMSNVYKLSSANGEEYYIPSIEYINELLKLLEDAVMTHSLNTALHNGDPDFKGFPEIKTDKVGLNILENILTNNMMIHASAIETDAAHMFITRTLLDTLIAKPTSAQLDERLNELKIKLEQELDNNYVRILNTPNAINKLRDISMILQEEGNLEALLQVMSEKVTTEDLKNHELSKFHLNDNDRKAINIILSFINEGCADWNATPDKYNYIRNKPESLPANGGNADTVANHEIKDVRNKHGEDFVIGVNNNNIFYDKDSCDIMYENTESLKVIDNYSFDCTALFKRGTYLMPDVYFKGHPKMIKGMKHLTVLNSGNGILSFDNMEVRDLTISGKVIISSNTILDNVVFSNCDITLSNAENCDIRNCVFSNCEFKLNGSFVHNVIAMNRFNMCSYVKYIGSDNVIFGNVY